MYILHGFTTLRYLKHFGNLRLILKEQCYMMVYVSLKYLLWLPVLFHFFNENQYSLYRFSCQIYGLFPVLYDAFGK